MLILLNLNIKISMVYNTTTKFRNMNKFNMYWIINLSNNIIFILLNLHLEINTDNKSATNRYNKNSYQL